MEGKRIQKPNMRPELGSATCLVLFNFTISWLFNFTKYWWYKKNSPLPYISPSFIPPFKIIYLNLCSILFQPFVRRIANNLQKPKKQPKKNVLIYGKRKFDVCNLQVRLSQEP